MTVLKTTADLNMGKKTDSNEQSQSDSVTNQLDPFPRVGTEDAKSLAIAVWLEQPITHISQLIRSQ